MRQSFTFHDIVIPTSAHGMVRNIKNKKISHQAHGNKVWNASLALMDYLSDYDVTDHEIMEIGCGWGVVSSMLARKGAHVQSVDYDPNVAPYYELIRELNNTQGMLRITDLTRLDLGDLAHIDWIVGADVCFWDEQLDGLVEFIKQALKAGVAEIMLADPGRKTFWRLEQYLNGFCQPELIEIKLNEPRQVSAYILSITNDKA